MRVDSHTWNAVFERDGGHCRYCGVDLLHSFSSWHSATVDHVIAVSAGGTDELSNLVLACPSYNHMLSRANGLHTFEERKTLLEIRRRERQIWYENTVTAVRGKAAP
ncbi:HNH endonuclease [Tahibacter caeni]|uniref:HNH endonuclease n=1 Tax=Tahibacter caeni TaxID=1453545 RepID=UPI00214932C6